MGSLAPGQGSGSLVAIASSPDLDSLAALLDGLGARVVRYPQGGDGSAALPLERWIAALVDGEFDDIVFSTAQGVHLIVEVARQLDQEGPLLRALELVRKIARGPSTAKTLAGLGLPPEVASRERTLNALLSELDSLDLKTRTVGVLPSDRVTEQALLDRLRARGARALGVAPTSAVDPKALEALAVFAQPRLFAVVFANKAQTRWLFDALRVSGHEGKLLSILRSVVIIASHGAAEFLRERGIVPSHTLGVAQLSQPQAVDLTEALELATRSVPPEPQIRATNHDRNIVVIGNGVVGHWFCRKLVEQGPLGPLHLVVFGEEPQTAYDRVRLSRCFTGEPEQSLELSPRTWYAEQDIELFTGERVVAVDRNRQMVTSSSGRVVRYDKLVFATGSAPLVPPVPGMDKAGVFVYRTLDDLKAIKRYSRSARTCAVMGGGLLGIEVAKAFIDMGVGTHLLESEPRLMPRQLDERGAEQLQRAIEALGVRVHPRTSASAVLGEHRVRGLRFSRGDRLDVDMLIVTAGIRPRDELARASGLALARQGGILVDEQLRTSDPRVYAVGECAIFRGTLFGRSAPGLEMASVLADCLVGKDARFHGIDPSARLDLPGVEVASLGVPFVDATPHRSVVFEDDLRGIYKKLVLTDDGSRLLGAILVGDLHQYDKLLSLLRAGGRLRDDPAQLVLTTRAPTLPAGAMPIEDAERALCTGRAPAAIACSRGPSAAESSNCGPGAAARRTNEG